MRTITSVCSCLHFGYLGNAGRGGVVWVLYAWSLSSRTAQREGQCEAYRLSSTWSIPAGSSQGKLIVVWTTNKSPPKKNKSTNNHVWLMEWIGSWHQHPTSLCLHAIVPLECSQKWTGASGSTGQWPSLLQQNSVCLIKKQMTLAKSIFLAAECKTWCICVLIQDTAGTRANLSQSTA